MEKDACLPTSKFPRKLTLRQRMAAATGLLAKSSRGQFGSRDPCYTHHPFSSPTTGFLGLEILSSPVPRIWPFAASVTILEGSEDFFASYKPRDCDLHSRTVKMARKMPARDQIVKLIVGAGQASPSPPVGPALGSKGVKSMDFCKVPTFCIRSAVGQ
jgi:hypothetical protein